MAALLRKVDSVRCKELGRRTGRRSSPMEQTPSPSWYQGRGGEQKRNIALLSPLAFDGIVIQMATT